MIFDFNNNNWIYTNSTEFQLREIHSLQVSI